MSTVREVTRHLLRSFGMTRVFGDLGSTELPFLTDFPEDSTYVLGLHEGVLIGSASADVGGGEQDAPYEPHQRPSKPQHWHRRPPRSSAGYVGVQNGSWRAVGRLVSGSSKTEENG